MAFGADNKMVSEEEKFDIMLEQAALVADKILKHMATYPNPDPVKQLALLMASAEMHVEGKKLHSMTKEGFIGCAMYIYEKIQKSKG